MNYVKLSFETSKTEDAELIMALLSDFEVQGFEQQEKELFAYFKEDQYEEAEIEACLAAFQIKYTKSLVPHENWNANWESNFEPVQVGNEIGIRAHFHPAFKNCKYEIVITPKMSFGTGHHETTQMMLEFGVETNFNGKSVFDFGTGTGVLAIFAALKGASKILAIDNDPWSIENAIENCKQNNCTQVEVSLEDIGNIHRTFDIILANINLNVLQESLPIMKKMLALQGQIYLSGILETDQPNMEKCISSIGLSLVSSKRKGNWLALHIN